MEIIKLGIMTADEDYGRALGRGLARRGRAVAAAVNETENCDLVLREDGEYLEAGGERVYKYAPPSEILRVAEQAYFFLYGRRAGFRREEGTLVVSVTSAYGGCGKTKFAKALAREMTRFHAKSVLFLDFSPFGAEIDDFRPSEGAESAASRLVYAFLKRGDANPSLFAVKDVCGVSYLPYAGEKNPLSDLDAQTVGRLLASLAADYDCLVCEVRGAFSELEMQVLAASDKICVLEGPESGERSARTQALLDYLSFRLGAEEKRRLLVPELCAPLGKGGALGGDYERDVKSFTESYLL